MLQVFNIINMQKILEIKYENPTNETVYLAADDSGEYLLVSFTTKKRKVLKNILYKINSPYFYRGGDDQKHTEQFFCFEVDLHLK